MKNFVLLLLFCFSFSSYAQNREYFPDSLKFEKVWKAFYAGDHEPELDDPLIQAGKPISTTVCKAILNKDMKYRRYAIGAIGFISDTCAIPALMSILKDTTEKDYFRGDALQAIYKMDNKLGEDLAEKYKFNKDYLGVIWKAIKNKEAWLLQQSEE